MNTPQKIAGTVNKIVSYIGVVIFTILIIACVMQVFFRFVLNNSLSWTEELARYCFVWMHLLGASLLIESSGHATVTALIDLFQGKFRKLIDVFIEVVVFVNGCIMLYSGVLLAFRSRANLSTAMRVPMWCVNSAVAVGGVLLMIQAVVKIVTILMNAEQKKEEVIL